MQGGDEFKTLWVDAELQVKTRTGTDCSRSCQRGLEGWWRRKYTQYNAVTQPNPISRSEIEREQAPRIISRNAEYACGQASLLLALITHNHLNKFIWHAAFTLAALIHFLSLSRLKSENKPPAQSKSNFPSHSEICRFIFFIRSQSGF